MKKILVFILALITPCVIFAGSGDLIEPFGKISWEDSFVQVVKKVKSMSPKTVLLKTSSKSVNIKGVSKGALSSKLRDVAKMHVPQYFNRKIPGMMDSRTQKYKDLKGNEKKYMDESYVRYSIEAFPIIILGVPFKIEVLFSMSPGLAIHKPGNVLSETTMGYTFPLILKGVRLFSTSSLLLDKSGEINDILRKKYQKHDKRNRAKWNSNRLRAAFKDRLGNQIAIKTIPKRYEILYASKVYENKLAKEYRHHLLNLNSKKGGKSMGSGL